MHGGIAVSRGVGNSHAAIRIFLDVRDDSSGLGSGEESYLALQLRQRSRKFLQLLLGLIHLFPKGGIVVPAAAHYQSCGKY